jgi:hypothetical protein
MLSPIPRTTLLRVRCGVRSTEPGLVDDALLLRAAIRIERDEQDTDVDENYLAARLARWAVHGGGAVGGVVTIRFAGLPGDPSVGALLARWRDGRRYVAVIEEAGEGTFELELPGAVVRRYAVVGQVIAVIAMRGFTITVAGGR